MQGVLLDQIGTHAREVTLWQFAQFFVEQMGHRQIEHRVAQELQAFVVVCAEAAMRERLLQQRQLAKAITQAFLQRL